MIKLNSLIIEITLDQFKQGKDVNSSGYKLTKAPNPNELLKNITYIEGYLDLSRSTITSLPNNLEVNGYLQMNNTKIETLPKGLVVRGDLYLLNCKNLKSFPNDLVVNGNMVLNSKKFNKEDLKEQLPNVNRIIIME
jgi:hypothetical protein